MQNRLRIHLVLAGTVALLAVIAFRQPSPEPPPVHRLPTTDPAQVHQIVIDRSHGPQVKLTKTAHGWFVEAPFAGPAHDAKINEMLRIFGLASRVQLAAAEHDLARFGLAPPKATLQVDSFRFEFGDTDALAGLRYVKSGAHLYLTNDLIYHHVNADAATFAQSKLIDPGREIVGLDLPDRTIKLIDGSWIDSSPDAGGAPANELINAWQQALAVRVSSFYPADPNAAITLHFARGDQVHFGLEAVEPTLVLSRRDRQLRYELPAGAAGSLLPNSAATLGEEDR